MSKVIILRVSKIKMDLNLYQKRTKLPFTPRNENYGYKTQQLEELRVSFPASQNKGTIKTDENYPT